MFTGIIEETGRIADIRRHSLSASLTVSCRKIMEDIHLGDSIAVNGICLTVTAFSGSEFTVDVMPETIEKTSLKLLKNGSVVNLERAMPADGRFGGHIVSGHIDGTGTVLEIRENEIAVIYKIGVSKDLADGIVEKGSVALDGISLTVIDVTNEYFTVSLIPHTRSVTNMQGKRVGDPINVETDVIGKYVKKYMKTQEPASAERLTLDFLVDKGFM